MGCWGREIGLVISLRVWGQGVCGSVLRRWMARERVFDAWAWVRPLERSREIHAFGV